MDAQRRTVADEIARICASDEALERYMHDISGQLDAAAAVIVRNVFGNPDDQTQGEIVDKALEELVRHAKQGSLAERTTRATSLLRWMHGIMRNHAFDLQRKFLRKRSVHLEEDLVERAELFAQQMGSHIDTPEHMAHIRDCLQNALSATQRAVIEVVMYADERLASKEIAELLRISAGSVDVHFKNGKDRLTDCLKRKGVLV